MTVKIERAEMKLRNKLEDVAIVFAGLGKATKPLLNQILIQPRTQGITFDTLETTILEDSALDTPDTPGCCEETAHDPQQEDDDASTSEQGPSDGQKEKNKKEKSSMKSKAHRPHHLKIPKALQRSFSAQSNGNQQAKAISVAVFLVEKVGRLLNLEYGKDTTAGLICKMMVENLAMSSQAKDVFCIWLVSPLLQLQLKDHHQPLRMRMKWPDLLRRFTAASTEMIEKDDPILSFQRNSFFPLQDERKV
ncbi:Hypothetical predicted protein [Paramuricea clavata]|uniref:Uncharacterized protein n=1 Tax=Paramuricea clavata TaxID=317549 RepID=A0A7D9L912_PARCT|nr:Hypothetical predicted protein [Paramuricea clavata]